jgi:transcriptional regulator with XRE-family HTH domain
MTHPNVQICHMDYELLARQLLRELRGARSQTAFSRRLGYSTNVAYTWESGRRFPTAAELFAAATRLGLDVRGAVQPFLQRHLSDELRTLEPGTREFCAELLRELRGTASIQALAERVGISRSALSRILSGRAEPRVPLFLRLVDTASRRVLDLLSGLVDVEKLGAAGTEWRRVQALRRLAHENPLSEAVPRFLELLQYEALPEHVPGWIAAKLGVTREEEERTLAELSAVGVVTWDGQRYQLDRARSVDTSRSQQPAQRALRAYWTDQARKRIVDGGQGGFAYLVFSTDDATLAAIEELRLRFFRELRALVAASQRAERVAVTNVQLFAIDQG